MLVRFLIDYENIPGKLIAEIADRSFAPPRDTGYRSSRADDGQE